MIHRHVPGVNEGDKPRDLMDREALAQWLGVAPRALPLDGAFVRVDAKSEERLYDVAVIQAALADRAARAKRRGPRVGHLIEVATRRPELT